MKKRVLIAGCGYVGSKLVELLANADYELYTINRSRRKPVACETVIQLDLSKPDSFVAIPTDLTHIVYALAAGERSPEAYKNAYVSCLENLIDYLKDKQVRLERFIFTSSTGVYAQNDASEVDESSPTRPLDFTGQFVLEGENLLRNSGLPNTSVRFGGIYGPGRMRYIQLVKEGKIKLFPEPSPWTNRIHRDDCAGVIKFIIDKQIDKSILVAVDEEPTQINSMLDWLASKLAVEIKSDTESNPSENIGKRCSSKLLRSLGYEFKYPSFREGYLSVLK